MFSTTSTKSLSAGFRTAVQTKLGENASAKPWRAEIGVRPNQALSCWRAYYAFAGWIGSDRRNSMSLLPNLIMGFSMKR